MKKILQLIGKILIFILIITPFALLYISLFHPELIKNTIIWIEKTVSILGNWNYGIIFLSAIIESIPIIGSAIPGTNIIVIIGGFWAKMNTFQLILTIIFASFGSMIGNFIGFFLGKKF